MRRGPYPAAPRRQRGFRPFLVWHTRVGRSLTLVYVTGVRLTVGGCLLSAVFWFAVTCWIALHYIFTGPGR